MKLGKKNKYDFSMGFGKLFEFERTTDLSEFSNKFDTVDLQDFAKVRSKPLKVSRNFQKKPKVVKVKQSNNGFKKIRNIFTRTRNRPRLVTTRRISATEDSQPVVLTKTKTPTSRTISVRPKEITLIDLEKKRRGLK